MTATAHSRPIFEGYRDSGCLEISAPARSYAFDFFAHASKYGASAPAGQTALLGSRLTKSEEEETIIINRPDRSTYLQEKSVLTSGATPSVT